ncbi:MAG: phospholipase D-like domain-containing protein, partial [Candidatus Thiodiazotropha sp.]
MNTQDTVLGKAFRAQNNPDPGQSGFLLLGSGLDAFVARAALARTAERSIDAQYYLLHDDMTGTLFVNELLKAAERGVRVRLLVDDMDLSGRELSAAALDAHENFDVRIFNPFGRERWRITELVTRFGEVTRRMHNKSFTVDNQATIVGGRNIGDEYFEANPALAFGDLDVLGFG